MRGDLVWTCHVCGRERPDERISVRSAMRWIGRVPVTQNVRYCNDRPDCIEGSRTVTFVPART